MSDQINDGGPAFPHDDRAKEWERAGMTLRDYFAAKALAVVWADVPQDAHREQALNYLGECAYEMADAMLAARKEKL